MPLPAIIGAAALRALPNITRGIVQMIQKQGRSAAVREHGKKAVQSAERAVEKVQPVRTAASKTKEAVTTQARKLVGRGNQVKRTKTGQAPQSKKTGRVISPKTVERYDRMGKRTAASRAKKAVGTTGAVGAGAVAVDQASQATAPKKTGTPKGQMKRGAKKATPSAGAKNYNVGVSKGGVSFDEAFAHFRKKGAKTFTWNGTKYTTELKKGK